MAKAKYEHCGEGPPVQDRSGWRMAPGDPPKSLPNGADATVLEAVRNKTLVKVSAVKIETVPDKKADDPPEKGKDNRALLKVIMKLEIDSGNEDNLTADGKPTIDYLRDEMDSEGGDRDFVTSTIRDELFEEIGNEE